MYVQVPRAGEYQRIHTCSVFPGCTITLPPGMAGTLTQHCLMTMYNSSRNSGSSRQNASFASDVRTFQPFEKPSRRSVRSIIRRYVK